MLKKRCTELTLSLNIWRLVIGRDGEGTGLFIGRKENDQPIALALHSDPNPFDKSSKWSEKIKFYSNPVRLYLRRFDNLSTFERGISELQRRENCVEQLLQNIDHSFLSLEIEVGVG